MPNKQSNTVGQNSLKIYDNLPCVNLWTYIVIDKSYIKYLYGNMFFTLQCKEPCSKICALWPVRKTSKHVEMPWNACICCRRESKMPMESRPLATTLLTAPQLVATCRYVWFVSFDLFSNSTPWDSNRPRCALQRRCCAMSLWARPRRSLLQSQLKAYHLHVEDLGHRLRLIPSSEFSWIFSVFAALWNEYELVTWCLD